jgi:hypothetical protein
MRFQKLRIAWSVAWGVIAVLLCVPWVRSYWFIDMFSGPMFSPGRVFVAGSITGSLGFGFSAQSGSPPPWTLDTVETGDVLFKGRKMSFLQHVFGTFQISGDYAVLPYSGLVLVFATLATAPWLRWRFSLRTLLIFTTLVAVGLGLIVWLSK